MTGQDQHVWPGEPSGRGVTWRSMTVMSPTTVMNATIAIVGGKGNYRYHKNSPGGGKAINALEINYF